MFFFQVVFFYNITLLSLYILVVTWFKNLYMLCIGTSNIYLICRSLTTYSGRTPKGSRPIFRNQLALKNLYREPCGDLSLVHVYVTPLRREFYLSSNLILRRTNQKENWSLINTYIIIIIHYIILLCYNLYFLYFSNMSSYINYERYLATKVGQSLLCTVEPQFNSKVLFY